MNATLDPPEAPELPPVDPRFHERRLAVEREVGRRRRRWIIAIALIVLLIAGAALLVRAPFLAVGRVTVNGAVYTDASALDAIADSVKGDPMLLLDEGALEAKLEALPWVRRATVNREWPDTVRIDVAERTPIAVVGGTDGLWHVLDAEGAVLANLEGRPVDVLLLNGTAPALSPGDRVPEAIAGAVRVAGALPPSLAARVGEIAFDANGNLELHLQPKGTIVFGKPDAVRDKLIAALTVLAKANPSDPGTIDVRAPADPVLTGSGQ